MLATNKAQICAIYASFPQQMTVMLLVLHVTVVAIVKEPTIFMPSELCRCCCVSLPVAVLISSKAAGGGSREHRPPLQETPHRVPASLASFLRENSARRKPVSLRARVLRLLADLI